MPILPSTSSRPSTPFSPKRALTRALMAAALMAGAGAALSAGSALANPCADGECSWGEWTTAGNFLTFEGSDKKWTYAPSSFVGTALPGTASIGAFKNSLGKYLVDVEFNLGANDFWDNAFSYNYIADIFEGNQTFKTVDIDSTTEVAGESLTKVFRKDSFTGDVVQTLASLSGSSEEKPVPGGLQTLYVSVAFNPGQGGMDSFQDSYTQTSVPVPGPLPVLGAGVAFGFSRRLRRRIQGDRVKA